MKTTETATGKAIAQQGIIFGLGFGCLAALLDVVYTFAFSTLTALLVALAIVVTATIVYVWAGSRAASQTGLAWVGAVAGLLTATISFIIGYSVNLVLAYTATDIMRKNTQAMTDSMRQHAQALLELFGHSLGTIAGINTQVTNQYIIQNATTSIGAIAIIAIIGAGLGIIGGLVGKKRTLGKVQYS